MHQDKINADKQAIQKLRDINPLNTTPDEALELQKQIRELEKDIASEERQRERAIDDLIRAAIVEGMARGTFGGPIPTPEQAAQMFGGGGPSQYTALASTTDPVAQRLTGRSQLSEGLQPLRMKPAPIDEGVGVSFFGGTDISHVSSSGLRGYSAWGLPTATGGWSSTSTLSGGGVRLDLSRPLGLPQDQRLAVAAGVWSSASSVQAGASFADFGFSSSAYPNSVLLGLSVGYGFGANYVKGSVAFDNGSSRAVMSGFGDIMSSRTSGYEVDLTVGRYFNIWNARAAGVALLTDGWKTLGVDVAGHGSNSSQRSDATVDAFRNLVGVSGGDVWALGISARFSALYKAGHLLLIPYAKFGFDVAPESKTWTAGAISRLGVPTAPIPNTFSGAPSVFSFDRTTGTIEGGLDISGLGGLTLSTSAYYRPASTTNTVGGRVSLKVPL